MHAMKYIESLAAKGRYHLTVDEAVKALGASPVAVRAALRRLRHRGSIAMPFRGFCVLVPPEYRRLKCLPPEQFVPQLMEHLGLDYYVGLLSAAEAHGAAHQRPQTFQVVVVANRQPIKCGEVRVAFVARHNLPDMPVLRKSTARGYVRISAPEATAYDLVGYAHRCGGLGNVATVLAEMAGAMAAGELVRLAPLSPIPWAQRLGHLLELGGAAKLAEPLAAHVAGVAREYVPLNPRLRGGGAGQRSARWKLLVNEKVEPDL